MYVFNLKSILGVSVVMLLTSMGFAASNSVVKTADLTGTLYCLDETKLKGLTEIVHLDERNQVDRIVVSKKSRKLFLLSQGRLYKSYDAAFGPGFYDGHKIKKGDGRTPEGIYSVELKNAQSAYRKALRVSYPNARDKAFAKANRVDPGGDIMIHGFPSAADKELERYALSQTHPQLNWTQGCVAVTDKEIDEIFSLIKVNTAIEICPR